jgi:phosphate transport system protein
MITAVSEMGSGRSSSGVIAESKSDRMYTVAERTGLVVGVGDSHLVLPMRTEDRGVAYQQQISALSAHLSHMCGMAAHAMRLATQALLLADPELAQLLVARQRAIVAVGAHAKRAALLLPVWRPRTGAVDTDAVLAAVRNVDDAERMGALAAHIATIARRRYPARAVSDAFTKNAIDMDALVLALAGHVCDLLLSRNTPSQKHIHYFEAVVQELQRRLVAVLREAGPTQRATAGVDITLLSQLYERFADHALQIGRRGLC